MLRKKYLLSGIFILLFLVLAYFIPLELDSGDNYVVEDTLLGVVIFHSSIVFLLYLTIGIVLLIIGSGVRFIGINRS